MRRRSFVPATVVSRERRRSRRRPGASPRLEWLETRQLLAVFTVNTTADIDPDPGQLTLREAILQANSTPESDTINFAIPGSGVQTIRPATPLPTITAPVFIDGTSQGTSQTPLIEIDGSLITDAGANGLTFGEGGGSTSSASTVRGLNIHSFTGAGIAILGADNLSIQGNTLGTNPAGTAALPNGVGISILNSSSNTIGGLTSTQRNVISGNTGAGIRMVGATTTSNVVQGNFIGVNFGGNAALPNAEGVVIAGDGTAGSGARDNTVGGTLVSARNVISGNTGAGIRISDGGASGNLVQGNYLGLSSSGTARLANAVGVEINAGASGNTIGGFLSSARNIISGNAQAGVRIDGADTNLVAANAIGTNADATAALPGAQHSAAAVLIQNGADSNTVGGLSSTVANVISGNSGAGVWIRGRTGASGGFSTLNVVQGNFIGTNSGGTAAIANFGHGVVVSEGATNNTVGATSSTGRNIISGNGQNGVLLSGFGTTGNAVQGNLIGTAADGSTALGNGLNGVLIDGASSSTVGGTLAGAANTIAFNGSAAGGAGVRVTAGIDNAIRRNILYNNNGLNIDLGEPGITPNDPMDPDPGPNLLQNFPILTSVTTVGSTTRVVGTLNSRPGMNYAIEFYTASGDGREARAFLGTVSVTTGTDGNASFSFTPATAVPIGQFVTALAIDPGGNTSEFSAAAGARAPQTDLRVTQSASVPTLAPPNTAIAGAFLTYTINVTNFGPEAASGVTLTDNLPTGVNFIGATATQGSISLGADSVTVSLGDLANGGSATVTITVVAPAAVPASGTLTNVATASLGSGQVDSNPADSTSTLVSPVIAGVDLALTQIASPNPTTVGQEVAILLTITNNSTTQATNVVVTDVLPENFEFTRAEATSPISVTQDGRQLTIRFNDPLPPAQSTQAGFSARITILGRPTAAGTLVNTAIVRADQGQTIPGDNSGFVPLFVSAATDGTPPPSNPSTDAGPRVLAVVRTGTGQQPTRLVLGFDQPLQAATAQDLSNYRLVSAGRDGVFGTRDDAVLRLAAATYDAGTNTVTLRTARPFGRQLLTALTVNGTSATGVTGTNGVLLDGNADGQPGGDFVGLIQDAGLVGTAAVDALLASDPSLSRPRRPRG